MTSEHRILAGGLRRASAQHMQIDRMAKSLATDPAHTSLPENTNATNPIYRYGPIAAGAELTLPRQAIYLRVCCVCAKAHRAAYLTARRRILPVFVRRHRVSCSAKSRVLRVALLITRFCHSRSEALTGH